MKFWKRTRLFGWSERGKVETPAVEDAPADLVGELTGAPWSPVLDDLHQEFLPTSMLVEVDDGLSVPVTVNEQNAPLIVDATQRLREYREREKASVAPVYNFGRDTTPWPSADW